MSNVFDLFSHGTEQYVDSFKIGDESNSMTITMDNLKITNIDSAGTFTLTLTGLDVHNGKELYVNNNTTDLGRDVGLHGNVYKVTYTNNESTKLRFKIEDAEYADYSDSFDIKANNKRLQIYRGSDVSDKNFLFMSEIDKICVKLRITPSIIKDSRLSKKVVEQCYPEYFRFRDLLNTYDKRRIYKSEISQRLEI